MVLLSAAATGHCWGAWAASDLTTVPAALVTSGPASPYVFLVDTTSSVDLAVGKPLFWWAVWRLVLTGGRESFLVWFPGSLPL